MQMRLELRIENTLSELGIDHSQIDRLATMATEDAAAGSNPIHFSQPEYKEILMKALGK
jgi:alcohol dehydrogenase class IV